MAFSMLTCHIDMMKPMMMWQDKVAKSLDVARWRNTELLMLYDNMTPRCRGIILCDLYMFNGIR